MFKHPDCIAVGIAVHVTKEQYTVIEYSSAQKYTKQLWGSLGPQAWALIC